MENQELKETVLCNLRSVTQSCKGGVPLDRLERDYRDLIGSRIPFRDLGYNSLESFVRGIPNVIRLTSGRNGSFMAEAVADSSTAHIASLISRQKQPKIVPRGAKRSHFSQRRGGYNPRYVSRPDRIPYSSYSAAKSSGRSYKQDIKISPSYHSRPSRPNFKIEFKNTNHIPEENSRAPIVAAATPAAPSAAPPKAKSRTVGGIARGTFEVPPRFQRLQQKKAEAKQQPSESSPTHSNSSPTPRNSVTPPRTPTPTQNPYAFTASSIASAASSRTSPTSENLPLPVRSVPSGLPVNASSRQGVGNGFYNSKQQSPRPLRRLNVAKSSQQLDSTETAKEYIELYAKINNLSVDYSTNPIGQKKKGFVTVLRLSDKSYPEILFRGYSYPEDALTEMEAEELAAKDAAKKIKQSQVLPETPISNAEEIQILLDRIEELVCEKPSGMFINGLKLEYESQFKEELPSCWVDLLKQSSVVDVDEIEVSYGKVPEGANFIVRPSRGFSSGSTTPSETSGNMYPELQDSENEEQSPRKDNLNNPVPPLVIPAGNHWGVFVTGVYTTESSHLIAARLVDNDDEFLVLLGMMSSYYDSKIDPVDTVEEGHLYATIGEQIEGELLMHRVLACSVGDEEIGCYYVDVGTVGTVRKSDLQHLHKDFLELPYQAVHFALDGLEDYIPFTIPEQLLSLKDRTLIAVVKRWCSEDYFPDDPGIHKVIYSVIFFDTSGKEDVSMNDTVKKIVSESLVCKLPKLHVSSQGYLTHVTKTGQIYVRFLHPVKSWLETELEVLYPLFEEACSETTTYIPSEEIFVAKCKIDNKWYRAVVPEHPNVTQDPGVMEVIFVDYGYPCCVKKSEICDLHLFSDFLSSLPYQAVKCELYNAFPSPGCKWTIPASQRLLELAPFEEELIIRVISEEEADALPKISLHKRIYSKGDSFIISINENLASKPELFGDQSAASSNGTVKAPSQLNLHRSATQHSSRGSLANYVPSMTSPLENSVVSHVNNLDIASPDGIAWVTTPDMVKSPEEEDLSPPPLSQPQVPEKGEIFDVYVTTAANPHNFIVQPLKSARALNDLRDQMQQFYSVEENLIEMHPSLLQRNSFYAALHSTNEWYRARLVSFNTNEPDEALICYVDFGDYDKVHLQNLQKLYNQFRALPCQAIKASLSGIMPIDVDWNPVHCVEFKEMVTENSFVAIVQNKSLAEEQGFPYLKLDLILINTEEENKDVFIHDLLIQKSMARIKPF